MLAIPPNMLTDWGPPSAITGCSPTAASRPRARFGAIGRAGSVAVEGPVIEWVATHRKLTASPTAPATRIARTYDPAGLARVLRGLVPRALGGFSEARTWPSRPLREGPARRPRPALHQPPLSARRGGLAGPFRSPRLRADRPVPGGLTGLLWAERCACASFTTRPSASTRVCHLLRPTTVRHRDQAQQLLAPCLPRRLRQAGTTTTTRSRPHQTRPGRRQLDPGAWLITGLER